MLGGAAFSYSSRFQKETRPVFVPVSFVQNLVELTQLPGLEEDKNFQKEVGLKTLVYKAYR